MDVVFLADFQRCRLYHRHNQFLFDEKLIGLQFSLKAENAGSNHISPVYHWCDIRARALLLLLPATGAFQRGYLLTQELAA